MSGNRLILAIEGTPLSLRIVPHKTDAAKLVLKAGNELAGPMLCEALQLPIVSQGIGSKFHLTFVDRQLFLNRMAERLGKLIGGNEPAVVLKHEAEPEPQLKLLGAGKCVECGCPDGTHWGFCPNNVNS